jgi:hypothetical protein
MQISPLAHSWQLHPKRGELALLIFLYPALQVHWLGLKAPGPDSAFAGQKHALSWLLPP